jgi:hypothetical protein
MRKRITNLKDNEDFKAPANSQCFEILIEKSYSFNAIAAWAAANRAMGRRNGEQLT